MGSEAINRRHLVSEDGGGIPRLYSRHSLICHSWILKSPANQGRPGPSPLPDLRSGRKMRGMAMAADGWWQLSVCWATALALALAVGCTKKEAPELAPAAAPPP